MSLIAIYDLIAAFFKGILLSQKLGDENLLEDLIFCMLEKWIREP